jgi:putative flavoprotein involved in K+ transport
MSAVLQQRGREHVVLERRQVGERWRTERWESLRFQFPNWSLELPGYAYSGDDPDGFAHWREILRVVEDYAASTRAPVREHTEVTGLRADDGGFVLSVPDGTIHARQVVVATGPFQRPRIPQLSESVCTVRAADRSDALPAPGRSARRRSTRRGQRCVRLPDRRRTAACRAHCVPVRLQAPARPAAVRRQGRLLVAGPDGPLHPDDRLFPRAAVAPSTVVTGVSGGYDVNVRQMAADGIRVVGRVIGASDGTLAIARNANEILDEADEACASFPAAAREFAAANPEVGLAEEEPPASAALPATVAEVESLDHAARERRGDHLGDRLPLRLRLAASPGLGRSGPAAPAARGHSRPGALLPGPALDAHVQIRPVLGRRQRCGIPRGPHEPLMTGR